MTGVSSNIKALYTDSYSGSRSKEWRDLGAVDKAANVIALWRRARIQPSAPDVVEIGCGEGALAAGLSRDRFFSSYQGFDISTSGVAEATARAVPAARFAVIDGDEVPVPDASADLVVLSHVVEHLEHPRVMLYEAARIAPFVFVEVPLELHHRAPRDYVVDDLGHINKYNALAIRHLVQSCGYQVLAAETTCVSLATAEFFERGPKRRLGWEIKSKSLKVAPWAARQLFTYHEALLLKSPSPAATADPELGTP